MARYPKLPDHQVLLMFKALYYCHKLMDPACETFSRFLHWCKGTITVESMKGGVVHIRAGHPDAGGTSYRDELSYFPYTSQITYTWTSDIVNTLTGDPIKSRNGASSWYSLSFDIDMNKLAISYQKNNMCSTAIQSLHNPWEKAMLMFLIKHGKELEVPFIERTDTELSNTRTVKYVNKLRVNNN